MMTTPFQTLFEMRGVRIRSYTNNYISIEWSQLLNPAESLVILMPGESVPSHMAHPACKEEETPAIILKPELEETSKS